MTRNKVIIGLLGLAVGFAVSFFWTRNYNNTHATAASTSSPGASAGAPANPGGGPPAEIQALIQKAKDNPKDIEAQLEVAGLYEQIGRMDEAVTYMKKALEIDPKDRRAFVLNVLVAAYHDQKKDTVEADKYFDRAIAVGTDRAEVNVEVADLLIQRQPPAPDKAIKLLDRALKANPKDGHALGHLIEAHLLKKDARAAEAVLTRLKEAEPTNQRIAIYDNLLADVKAGKPITIPREEAQARQ